MSSARQDYQQFIGWLHQEGLRASDDARRFANLVEDNFDRVAAASRTQSRRSAVLTAIAKESLSTANAELPEVMRASRTVEWEWSGLNSLAIGPFRGFRAPETFNFPRRITMFYGPNGSGKTSLCEALELALLGVVDEASAKRIAPQRYFANLHEGRFVAPILTVRNNDAEVSQVASDSEAYRFCFIEKNRIDNFSRIAAKTAGEKKDLIASLFGMQQFHDFVSNFNESMDSQLNLVSVRGLGLTAQRAAVQRDQETVDGEAAAIEAIDREEAAHAEAFRPGLTYPELMEMIGSDQHPGGLHALNAQLDVQTPSVFGIDSAALDAAYSEAEQEREKLDGISAQLAAKTGETSFFNLYTALLELQEISPDNCPACGTTLSGDSRVARNPYDDAQQGLAALRELADLQRELAAARRSSEDSSRNLETLLSTFAQRIDADAGTQDERVLYLLSPGVDHDLAWWRASLIPAVDGTSMAQKILEMAAEYEAVDARTNDLLASRAELVRERELLLQANQAAIGFATRRVESARQVGEARQAIDAFNAANAQLIEAVQQEAEGIALDERIKAAYDEFLGLLRQFRAELPGTLIAGLNTTALEIYNEFNRRDHEGDKLSALHLPTDEDARIELSFCAAPQNRVDALHVLSEGHVRCLGVAILLAKALHVQTPTIIFDDAINAIDTEHREGIREAIFESDRFAATQIIVTCHSSEFIKDIQNHVEATQWTAYYFMPHLGDHRPRVRGNENTFNYLLQARSALDMGDWRNALGAARQNLEMLTDKIWKWLAKNDLGMLTVPLAGRGAEPALRNLCEALKRRLDDARTFIHPDKPGIVQGLGAILGVPAPSNVWTYLNKGIHEEANRDDYDPNLVRTVVETLEAMNRLQLRAMPATLTGIAQAAISEAVAATALSQNQRRDQPTAG